MNKYFALISIILIFTSCFSVRNLTFDKISKQQGIEDTRRIVEKLSSDEFEGRKPGTEAYDLTVKYVSEFLESNMIKAYNQGGYKDTCEVKGKVSYNIVGLIGQRDPNRKHILIGAHLDHLGISRNKSDSIYNGANDNASGVTAVLQIAKVLNKYKFEQNIIIALFTGEESGLVGSKHLAKKLKAEGINLSYMLNFEMIGKTLTSGANQVYITGFDKSNCAEKVNKILDRDFVVFLPAEIPYMLFRRSDNAPFYNEFGVPCHTISTFDFENYQHYHKVSDEVSELDVINMNQIINSSTLFISKFLLEKTEITNSINLDN